MATTLPVLLTSAEQRAEADARMIEVLPDWVRQNLAEVDGKPAAFFGERYWSCSAIVRRPATFGRDFALVYVNLLTRRPVEVIEATFCSLDDAVEAWRA